jgi:hypothetical protein
MKYKHGNNRGKVRHKRYENRFQRVGVAQADIKGLVEAVFGRGLTVRANGRGYRIECDRCGWSEYDVPVQDAIEHAATH